MTDEKKISSMIIPPHYAIKIGHHSALSQSIVAGISEKQSFPRISIKDARFCILEDGTETTLNSPTLDLVIVGANPKLSKTFYANDIGEELTEPDCYSLDGIHPHPESHAPQNNLCSTCPHNAWGSKIGPQGQQLKACIDHKRLAVVASDDPEGPVYLLQVTAAALKSLKTYHKTLSMRGIPAEIVATKISFDTDALSSKLKFGFGGFLDEDTYAAVELLFGAHHVLEITGQQIVGSPAPDHHLVRNPFVPTSETSLSSSDALRNLSDFSETGDDIIDDANHETAAQWLMRNHIPEEVISTYYARVIDGMKNIRILAEDSREVLDLLDSMIADDGLFAPNPEYERLFLGSFSGLQKVLEEIKTISSLERKDLETGSGTHIEDRYDAFAALSRILELITQINEVFPVNFSNTLDEINDLNVERVAEVGSILEKVLFRNSGIIGISHYFSMLNDIHKTNEACVDKIMMVPGEKLIGPLSEEQVAIDEKTYAALYERIEYYGISWSEAMEEIEKLISWPQSRWEV